MSSLTSCISLLYFCMIVNYNQDVIFLKCKREVFWVEATTCGTLVHIFCIKTTYIFIYTEELHVFVLNVIDGLVTFL